MAQENNRKLTKAAGKGTMEGETGVKFLAGELIKFSQVGPIEVLNFSEKPFFRTAFWAACQKNQEPVVKFLLEKQVDINKKDYLGRSPLHEAA